MATDTAATAATKKELWAGKTIPFLGITGGHNSGKTLFVLSVAPEESLVIDVEESSVTYELKVGRRVSITQMLRKLTNPKPVDRWLAFRDAVEKYGPQHRVLIVDPISDVESGLTTWVESNPTEFGHTANQYKQASGLMWGDLKDYWKLWLSTVAPNCECFCWTVHLGQVFGADGKPIKGKTKPKGKSTLMELASLYLHLERKANETGVVPGIPSGAVIKTRLANMEFDDEGDLQPVPLLPPYMKQCTPKIIRKYILNPPDLKKLKAHERIPQDVITEDDRLAMQLDLAAMQLQKAKLEHQRDARIYAAESLRRKSAATAETRAQDALAGTEASTDANGIDATAGAEAVEMDDQSSGSRDGEPSGTDDTHEANVGKDVSTSGSRLQDAVGSGVVDINARQPGDELDEPPTVYEILELQRRELNINDSQWQAVLASKHVKATTDLPIDTANLLRERLASKLTMADLKKTQ